MIVRLRDGNRIWRVSPDNNDNMDRILLPENMFVNLMDLDLQDRIANTDKYNYDVKNALELLLENGPVRGQVMLGL